MPSMSDELVRWLGEQLDEDERTARAATQGDWVWTREFVTPPGYHHRTIGPLEPGDAVHIARHEPARVLQEIEAKRGVLRQYEGVRGQVRNPVSAENRRAARIAQGELEDVVRLLAVPYSDRPGYREEWRP